MKKGYIEKYKTQFGGGHATIKGFGDKSFSVQEIGRKRANELVTRNHYSGTIYRGSFIHLGVFADGELKGVLQFGPAMNPASQASVVAGTEQDQYLELNRMWLSDDLPRNSESKAISYSVKYIKRVYPRIQWIQSFADERCGGLGVVYQAANFDYFGEHTATFWGLDGQTYHNSLMTRDPKLTPAARYLQRHKGRATRHTFRQFRYLYFIDKRSRDRCLLKEQPYPKRAQEAA